MDDLKCFLSRQSTAVLQATLTTMTTTEDITMVNEILTQRTYLSQKYTYRNLLGMTPDDLVKLLNSPELRIIDLVISRSIMKNILDIMQKNYPETDVIFCEDLIWYLRKWSIYSVDCFELP